MKLSTYKLSIEETQQQQIKPTGQNENSHQRN